MRQILKALMSFIMMICFAFGLEAQAVVYQLVPGQTLPKCSVGSASCGSINYSSGLCVTLDYFGTNSPVTANFKVTLSGGGAFNTSGTIFLYENSVCGGSIANVAFNATQTSRNISVPLTFSIGTTKHYYVAWVPSSTSIAKRWSGPVSVQAVACTKTTPLLTSPTNNQSFAAGTTSVNLSWNANGNTSLTKYYVTVKKGNTFILDHYNNNYSTSKAVAGLTAGAYTWFVSAEETGCTTATSETRNFSISAGTTGSLTVNISPSNIGGQWRVDGGAWYNSGQTVVGLTVGNHTVTFSTVAGYTTPSPAIITIVAGQTATYNATYTVPGATCGTVKIFTPRQNSNNNARSTLVSWEVELNRGIVDYTMEFIKVSTGQSVTINGNTLNLITVTPNSPALLTFPYVNANDLEYATEYRIILRGRNSGNQEIVNNVADDFRYTTMASPNIQPTPTGCTAPATSFGTPLGHLNNVAINKNGYFYSGCSFDSLGLNYSSPAAYYINLTIPSNQNTNITVLNYNGHQCVEYITRYMAVVYGVAFQGYGLAKNYFANASIPKLKSYTNGITTELPRTGDVICLTNSGAGHIAIVRGINTVTQKVEIAQQNIGYNISNHISQSVSYSISNSIITVSNFQGATVQGWLRAEPKLTVAVGSTKAESGNSNFVQFNSKPTFTIEQHTGSPTFKVGISRYNTATNCYDIHVANLTNLPNTGTAISNIPALPIGKYKARVTVCSGGNCNNFGVPSRPVYFEMLVNANLDDGSAGDRSGTTTLTEMMIYPNPTDDEATIQVTSPIEQFSTFELFDATGMRILSQQKTLSEGLSTWELHTSSLPNGIYLCKLHGQDMQLVTRLIVAHG